jgi:hypothetical protein
VADLLGQQHPGLGRRRAFLGDGGEEVDVGVQAQRRRRVSRQHALVFGPRHHRPAEDGGRRVVGMPLELAGQLDQLDFGEWI